jgi:hypothetical protein
LTQASNITAGDCYISFFAYIPSVRDIQEIRHQNLQFLVEECASQIGRPRGAVAQLATLCNVKPSLLSMLVNRVSHSGTGKIRLVGDDTATKLELGMGKDPGWMDVDRSLARDYREAAILDKIRLLSQTQMAAVERVLEEFASTPKPADGPVQPHT